MDYLEECAALYGQMMMPEGERRVITFIAMHGSPEITSGIFTSMDRALPGVGQVGAPTMVVTEAVVKTVLVIENASKSGVGLAGLYTSSQSAREWMEEGKVLLNRLGGK